MRVFDVIQLNRRATPPRYAGPPVPYSIYGQTQRFCVIVKDDEGDGGWEIFSEVDGLLEGQLIAKALNAPDMRKSVEEGQKVSKFEATLELFGHQLSSIDARLQALEDN